MSFAYKYDPWGVQTLTAGGTGNGAGQNPYAFHAGIKDPGSGLVKFGLRWYNPITGTWTQQDTLDHPLDPANANRYAYAGDDPINNLDPNGQGASFFCVAGVLAGLAATAYTVGEVLDLGVTIAGIPETGGLSLIAGAALTAELSVQLAASVGLAGYSFGKCVE